MRSVDRASIAEEQIYESYEGEKRCMFEEERSCHPAVTTAAAYCTMVNMAASSGQFQNRVTSSGEGETPHSYEGTVAEIR